MTPDVSATGLVSLLFVFWRYRFPTMGKRTAESGILATGLLLIFFLIGPNMKPNLQTSALFVLGLLFIGSSCDSYLKQATAQIAGSTTSPPPSTSCIGNCVLAPNSGTIIQNFNSQPQRLRFSDELGKALVGLMPDSKKAVSLTGVGGATDQMVVSEIYNFLINNSYHVQLTRVGVMGPPPDKKVSFSESSSQYLLLISPSTLDD